MNTSRKLLIAGATALAAAAFSSAAFAQASANGSASAKVQIITPITITKDTDLQFGKVVADSTNDGEVVIGVTSDTATASGGATALSSTTSRAQFTVNGEPNEAYTLTIPTSDLVLDNTNAPGLVVTSFTTSGTAVTLGGNALSATGSDSFYVGGTLKVPHNTKPGSYTGSFQVTVAYN